MAEVRLGSRVIGTVDGRWRAGDPERRERAYDVFEVDGRGRSTFLMSAPTPACAAMVAELVNAAARPRDPEQRAGRWAWSTVCSPTVMREHAAWQELLRTSRQTGVAELTLAGFELADRSAPELTVFACDRPCVPGEDGLIPLRRHVLNDKIPPPRWAEMLEVQWMFPVVPSVGARPTRATTSPGGAGA